MISDINFNARVFKRCYCGFKVVGNDEFAVYDRRCKIRSVERKVKIGKSRFEIFIEFVFKRRRGRKVGKSYKSPVRGNGIRNRIPSHCFAVISESYVFGDCKFESFAIVFKNDRGAAFYRYRLRDMLSKPRYAYFVITINPADFLVILYLKTRYSVAALVNRFEIIRIYD